MKEQGVYKIRPAGRHLSTIGKDLIQDECAAIVELVKNAYDADSPDVTISFDLDSKDTDKYILVIEDHGHGMTKDVIINSWLVPSTDYKMQKRSEPQRSTNARFEGCW